jgi:polyisoprenyl-teichoic acid--peptidoglycan teichoic acid transferase
VPGVERLEPDQAGADEPACRELGRGDAHVCTGGRQRLPSHDLAGRTEEKLARCREPAADDDDLRMEDVDQTADASAEPTADLGQHVAGAFVALTSQMHKLTRIGARPEDLARGGIGGVSGGERLEVSPAGARSLTPWPVVEHHHVTELCPAAKRPPVEDDAAADAGPEREHDHVPAATPGADAPFGERGCVRVVLDPYGKTEPLAQPLAKPNVRERDVGRALGNSLALVNSRRHSNPEGLDAVVEYFLDRRVERCQKVLLRGDRRRALVLALHRTRASDDACGDLRAAEVDADDALIHCSFLASGGVGRLACHGTGTRSVATITGPMARGDKPYRVYRGGRVKGKVPTLPRPESPSRAWNGRGEPARLPGVEPRRRRRLGWGARIALALGLLVVLLIAWAVTSYLAFRGGVAQANDRLDAETRAALTPQDGLLLNTSTTVLLLGTDHANREDRAAARRSDSILLLRTDPDRGRVAVLSIPRDLRVNVPGQGYSKINSALQVGGPALALRTVRNFTGLPIHHVAIVDFGSFVELVDAVGGITVDVPAPIVSNRFDCPLDTQAECDRWPGWRFGKGKQHMNGRRALVYARIRENRLNPAENDITRGERAQAVLQAITHKLTRPGTLLRMPFIGDELVRSVTTDLSAAQFVQLGWLRFRTPSSRTLHCRLGGTGANIGGESFLLPAEENRNVITMFAGASAPQPPLPGSGPFGPGCLVG